MFSPRQKSTYSIIITSTTIIMTIITTVIILLNLYFKYF